MPKREEPAPTPEMLHGINIPLTADAPSLVVLTSRLPATIGKRGLLWRNDD